MIEIFSKWPPIFQLTAMILLLIFVYSLVKLFKGGRDGNG